MEQYFSELDLVELEEEKKAQELYKEEVEQEISANNDQYKCICIYTDIISYLEKNGIIELCNNLTIDKIIEVMGIIQKKD